MIVEDFHVLMDAHVAMMAACDLFALTPTWRTVWENELGPVYEDLTVIETITETVQSRSMAPMVLSMAASLVLWLDELRLAALPPGRHYAVPGNPVGHCDTVVTPDHV